jgi:hypothetical protein
MLMGRSATFGDCLRKVGLECTLNQAGHVAPNWGQTSLLESMTHVSKGLEATQESSEVCSTKLGSDFAARADCFM